MRGGAAFELEELSQAELLAHGAGGGGGRNTKADRLDAGAVWWSASQRQQERSRRHTLLLWAAVALGALSLMLGVAALSLAAAAARHGAAAGGSGGSGSSGSSGSGSGSGGWGVISRIAFSSCTSYDLRAQPIWTQGVIPARPDAWVWLGDSAYYDDPFYDCNQVPDFPQCNCTPTFMRRPPFQCFAGDPVHARTRAQYQLGIPEYRAFLSYMCPDASTFPPRGTDPRECPRPIVGVYDDHDFGWNNGDGRNPAKHEIKNIYLDAIGEAPDSPRRSSETGLQAAYVLPGPGSSGGGSGDAGASSGSSNATRDEIQLVLLDERYFRETLPCSAREEWCRKVLATPSSDAGTAVWCRDFLIDGGPGGRGSCCRKDDEWLAWCGQAANAKHARWRELCDPTSPGFAASQLVLDSDNATVLPLSPGVWARQRDLGQRLLEAATSPLCEVLGPQQREWLRRVLAGSRAALTLVASGSVLAGSLGFGDAPSGTACSGDDLACWPRAQRSLLHTLASGARGCVVVLTGDYHYSDLKKIAPGGGSAYAAALDTGALARPVWQAMASGMTFSTAKEEGAATCRGSFREDLVGLRPLGRCSYVAEPAFGLVEVDWRARVVSISIRNHTSGGVAVDAEGVAQRLRFDIDSCAALPG